MFYDVLLLNCSQKPTITKQFLEFLQKKFIFPSKPVKFSEHNPSGPACSSVVDLKLQGKESEKKLHFLNLRI